MPGLGPKRTLVAEVTGEAKQRAERGVSGVRTADVVVRLCALRVFGSRRCSKCLASISSSELVMRARHLVFHIRCFSCAICNTPLNKGDHFTIRDSAVFCRSHIELPPLDPTTAPSLAGMPMQCPYQGAYGTSPNAPLSPSDSTTSGGKLNPATYYPPHGVTGLPQQPRQKGRPRKRKPKDIEAMTASLDLNTEYLDLGFSRGLGSSSRAKRMRTSFKHHQLRTMKSYFAINHNPDAKDLKQLSQKTGLPKRVLQVWFQNARAKMAPDDDEAGGQNHRLGQGRRFARPGRLRVAQSRLLHHGRPGQPVLARLATSDVAAAVASASPTLDPTVAEWRRWMSNLAKRSEKCAKKGPLDGNYKQSWGRLSDKCVRAFVGGGGKSDPQSNGSLNLNGI
ncbi:AGAP008980-PA-like protein [Anopheles sinensis]|uniref:AGAP008980-PA-like protein n=1 Tax=Anopheles sinensis TaxID=74873 RepID=A0A084VBP3_ANOSI|nr:AGAP008980-PA-like protein [Anopheles sinensis]